MTARPVVLITGASSGIGAALARVFAAHGHDLALVALPDPQLDALADEIAAARPRPITLPLDLTERDIGLRIAERLAALGAEPTFVINCAGFGLVGAAAELDQTEQLAMVDLNVRALTDLSLRFVDSLKRHRGGLLNVASVSAFLPGPGMAVYNATKTFVLSFSEALHRELKPGVRVTALCSGPVPTRFQTRAGIRATLPRVLACSPEFVAQEAFAGLMAGRRLVVPGAGNKLLKLILPLIPRVVLLPGKLAAMRFSTRPPATRPLTFFRRDGVVER
jgi:short-subunit dehydrogenase